jgi:hypothetical protein
VRDFQLDHPDQRRRSDLDGRRRAGYLATGIGRIVGGGLANARLAGSTGCRR